MYRKMRNTGPFADLEVPMQHRVVGMLAKEAGIGLGGVKIRIIRDPELLNGPFLGRTSPEGVIELYPHAFTDKETLIMTLGHERTHVYQVQTFGAPASTTELKLNEEAAYAVQDSYWQYYLENNTGLFTRYEENYELPRLA
jgi:hypothetical protein